MEWNMLKESKKLFPHWLDKSKDSNFSKHLNVLNNQQMDIRHKLKTIEWGKLLNKPLQIHKIQTEPYKWDIEFEVNVPQLKKVNIYKNPTIVDNNIVNSFDVINGYLYEGNFYENYSTLIKDSSENTTSEEDDSYNISEITVSEEYFGIIEGIKDKFYFDLSSKKYYKFTGDFYLEVSENDVPQTSLIYSESFIDNYSHFFRHTIHENNSGSVLIQKYVFDEEGNKKHKTIFEHNNENNGKYELNIVDEENVPILYYNITFEKYGILDKDGNFIEVNDEKIIKLDSDEFENININNEYYYIIEDKNQDVITSKIPLIETEDITPIISDDKYVLELFTWNDYHFLKGFPEIDFIDYNNNNIIEDNEKNYDNLSIKIEKINNKEYLTFRVHQYGIKLVEIFKDSKPIHVADFIVEKLGYGEKQINTNFAHIYNYNDNKIYSLHEKDTDSLEVADIDVDEYVWRLPITEEDKIFDENGNFELKNKYDIKVTYYSNPLEPYNSDYDKILMKTYVGEDTIFYHDVSLDKIGKLYNIPRHVFKQPLLEDYDEKIEFYSKTYPTYSNTLSEDDYHYQKRLEYYINNYNKVYFPVLELWKYFHIDSELVNRKVIIAEQNYSYMRNLRPDEFKYINELSKNKFESYYLNEEYVSEEEEKTIVKTKLKSSITSKEYEHSRNGILIDDEEEYIRDVNGTPVRVDYDYYVDDDGNYNIKYDTVSNIIQWYNASHPQLPYHDAESSEIDESIYRIKLTDLLRVVPNTRYQLRFCLKKYPHNPLKLKLIYKNSKGDVREIQETVPLRKDCDESEINNELIYSDYEKEWGVSCEYICTDFLTSANAQYIEICLDSESDFKVSDVTLQRITINHFDSEYMRTSTDYNSCVYDLYADYNKIPTNIKYDDLSIFNKILNRSLPISKKGYFNFAFKNSELCDNMNLSDKTNIYISNMLDVESGIISYDNYNDICEHTYNFNKYVKYGEYEIIIKPYSNNDENQVIFDLNMDISMLLFTDDNHAIEEKIEINNFKDYFDEDENYFRIPFLNKSNNSFSIKIYRDDEFGFKNFKLIRKSPLTVEEITK